MAQDLEHIGGFHAVTAALEARRPVVGVWLAAGHRDARARVLAALAQQHAVAVHAAGMDELNAMLPHVRHQGCVAALSASAIKTWHESELPGLLAATEAPWVLALDQVQDPHNLGACLRSAAAANVTAVIAPRKRAAGLTAAVRKVAAGAAERVPFVPVTNLTRAIKRLQADGFWAVGFDGDAPQRMYATDLSGPVVLVLGNEARGLRALTAETCDMLASIPLANGIESLNISVAAGVALFEAVRQRKTTSG